jgi:hypothetical protein
VSSTNLCQQQNDIICLSTGSGSIILGDSHGGVRILSRNLTVSKSFQASDAPGASVTQIRQIPDTALLVTVAEDLSNEPILKVWALDKTEKKTGGPKCLCAIAVQNQRKLFPISAFVVLDDLSQVAVGFANGAVTVIRGDLIHDRGTKQRTVFESDDPITALEVRDGPTTVLFIATTGRICSLVISGKGQGQQVRSVDNQGCGVGCMTTDRETKDIIIAREDAIYYYGLKGRGPSFAFEGPKKLVRMYKDYVGLLCPPRVAQISKSKTFRRLGGNEADELMSSSSFTLLDTDLRYIAHTESLPSQVKDLFIEWNELFLLTLDGKLYRYQEKTLQQKLEILFQRNLYILAINLAQKSGIDTIQQNIIFRKYGDFLYQKGDYDTAMQQYLRAIDNTEPSQVIRKFLDTQRIHNLIEYLEELHEHGKATADHTTLLLNCYAKLKDTEKLDAFVKAPGEIKFDLDTAIAMCRQGGYYEQAAYLARKHGEHELVIDILIEDSHEYATALKYIWRLPADAAYAPLMKYSRVLISHCSREATDLFIQYYTGKYQLQEDAAPAPEIQQESAGAFSNLSSLLPLPYMHRSAVASPGASAEQSATVADAELASAEKDEAPTYPVPAPRTAFSSFIAHPTEFITFLEALLSQPALSVKDRTDLSTTLFELYLESANSPTTSTDEKTEWQTKAKALISSSDAASSTDPSISPSNVLLLSSLTKFPAGTTLIRERATAYADIFRAHTAAHDTPGAISALRRYGPEDLSLYPLALSYFSSSAPILDTPGVRDLLREILRRIDNENLMAPLQVVKVLSQGEAVTMGMIKDYLADNIARERNEITSNRKLIDSYRGETVAKAAELEDLASKPVVFQSRRCASCGGTLDLPTVHFLCKHSFHQRCLNSGGMGMDDKAECPLCKPQHDTIRAIRRAQIENTDQHDLFRGALARSVDRFGTVSEWFGRGVMGPAPLVD